MNAIAAQELSELRDLIARLASGEWSRTDFRAKSVHYGVYTQKQTDRFFVRVRIPHGVISPAQIAALADAINAHARGTCHLTTRQGVEVHDLLVDEILPLLTALAEVNLYSHETGGSAVRGIMVCPHAGTQDEELFDITPHAARLTELFFRNPDFQSLPRKMKIGFSCCASDCAHTTFQDLGFQARINPRGEHGFRVLAGGGTGALPRLAQELFEFIPCEEVPLVADGFLRMFNRLGDRQNRSRARVKFLVQKLGIEKLREEVQQEIAKLRQSAQQYPELQTNGVVPQRVQLVSNVQVTFAGGDVRANQLRSVAQLAESLGLEIRTTPEQAILFRRVPNLQLSEVRAALSKVGSTLPMAASRLLACPGASGCSNAFTHAPGVANALRAKLSAIRDQNLVSHISIRVSGCMNGCGMHACADVGLEGIATRAGENWIPAYRVWVGGMESETMPRIGTDIGAVPARRVPECVVALLESYTEARRADESFGDFVERVGPAAFREIVARHAVHSAETDAAELAIDWSETARYQPRPGKAVGVC